MTGVYLVDDHALLRAGLRATLEEVDGLRVVGEAGDVPSALRGIEETRPDVALLDVRLPGGNGIELAREVRSRTSATRCIILTSFAEHEAFYQALMAGAHGFLLKDVPSAELVSAIQRVASGESLLTTTALDALRAVTPHLPPDDELLGGLTPREREILDLIAQGRTNREIAEELFLAEKTVRNYVSNLLSKLGMRNRTQVAAYIVRRGVGWSGGAG